MNAPDTAQLEKLEHIKKLYEEMGSVDKKLSKHIVYPSTDRTLHYIHELQLDELVNPEFYREIGLLISLLLNGPRHPNDDSYKQIPQSVWKELFINTRRYTPIRKQILETLNDYLPNQYSKGYKLIEPMQEKLMQAEVIYTPTRLGNGQKGVQHKRRSGRNSRTLDIPTYVTVDIQPAIGIIGELLGAAQCPASYSGVLSTEVEKLRERYHGDDARVEMYLRSTLTALNEAISLTLENDSLPQAFRNTRSGRWYGAGVSLQNTPKLARKLLFQGHYEYDIESCAQTVILHTMNDLGYELPALLEYVTCKKDVRERLSSLIGDESVSRVKTLITAITNGSPLHTKKMKKLLSDEQIQTLKDDPYFTGLLRDLNQAAKTIVNHPDFVSSNRQDIVNAIGYRLPKKELQQRAAQKKSVRGPVVNHIITGHESTFLSCMIQVSDNPVLCLHDALITPDEIDIKTVKDNIEQLLGYSPDISSDQYPVYSV